MPNKLFIIGINDYQHQTNLKSCVKDVTDFKNLLLEKFDFTESHLIELLDKNATSKKIQDIFSDLISSLTENDNLIIYFSGHGSYNKNTNIGYWVPTEGFDYTNWLANDLIATYIEKIKAKHVFVISDSCFSNSLLSMKNTKSIKDYYDYNSRWALCSAFDESFDSDGISNTLFADVILQYLENAETDIRVSELIEEVKRNFLENRCQKPQGYPLQIKGHQGGEFIFKIKQRLDSRTLKGYIDFEKILKLYKRNSDFKELSKYEEKSLKIGFQLFQEVDAVIKKATYYLYLYEGINQIQTLKYLNENFPKVTTGKSLVILLPVEKNLKNNEQRKKNIQEKFKPISIFFIDEFIKEHCTPKIILDDDSKYLNISNFIIPILNQDENKLELFFENWYNKLDEPILVLKGSGGIGKTTLSQYLADKSRIINKNSSILYIDSIQIKDSLLKNKNRGNLNLYNFYEALYEITDDIEYKLSEELFRINIDAGNILLIIDGLDEVISKIPNFKVNEFLQSIKSTTSELGNGKVIITCRTYFWDQTEFLKDDFSVIELEPFNSDQAQEFFKKSFGGDLNKIKKGIKIANDFKFPGSEKENIYHPYVLDIIRSIIDSENEVIDLDFADLQSEYLSSNNKNDYIVYKVCDRERKRVGQISVDEQIKFFVDFAVKKRGTINNVSLKHEIEISIKRTIDKVNGEAFKSHPFLKRLDNQITFKYDFLSDLFKSIYVSSFFNYNNKNLSVTNFLIDLIIENCWYGSSLNNDIVQRIEQFSEDDILLVSDIISQIRSDSKLKLDIVKKATGNIFNLCLNINHKFKNNNIDTNTDLLKNLFEISKNKIDRLYLININSDQNVKFNFSNLVISNSSIISFSSFWKCTFNENTKFANCEIFDIKLNNSKTSVNKSNFIDCAFDSDIETSLKLVESKDRNLKQNLKIFLNDFFHLFFTNGKLGRQWEHKVIEPRFRGINKLGLDYNATIKTIKKSGIIEITKELNKNKFFVNESHKSDIEKFIKDGTISKEISELLRQLEE